MKATLVSKQEIFQYNFKVDYNNKQYDVTIYMSLKNKFIEIVIEHADSDSVLYDLIVDYIDKNWDSIVK